ncbi:MAG: hypothetical protein AB7S26_13660 [Sandaracinaceae bacterium]
MRVWLIRLALFAIVLGGAAAMYRWLAPYDLEIIPIALASFLLTPIVVELGARALRDRRSQADFRRWRDAVMDPERYEATRDELRAALADDRPRNSAEARRARLAICLAELELAHGSAEAASEALARVRLGGLSPGASALVRLARTAAYLHAGDVERARAGLAALDDPGDPFLALARQLAEAGLALEEGDASRALTLATEALKRADPGDELFAEASVLAAAAELALDRSDDARARLALVPAPLLARARRLAPRSVRATLRASD